MRARNVVVSLAAVVGLLASGQALAQDMPKAECHGAGTAATQGPSVAMFERIKQLEGTWTGTSEEVGDAAMPPMTVVYHVVAAGSAVVETLFPGTEHEMVTVYHRDGDSLMLTHYCTAGNQPRMRAVPGEDPNTVTFAFDGGTNLDPARDMHMHDLRLTFVDANTLRAEWTSWKEGKAAGTVKLDLKRSPA